MSLPQWKAKSDPRSLQLLAELMVKYDLTKKEPPAEKLLRTGQ